MTIYRFREDGVFKFDNAKLADPQKIGEAVKGLEPNDRGARAVVDAARDPKHPAHICLEWDNEKIGDKWRLEQARSLIASIEVVELADTPNEVRKRAFVSLSNGDGTGRSYRAVEEIEHDPALQRILLEQALAELKSWLHRFRDLAAIAGHVAAAQKAAEALLHEMDTDKAA